MSCFTTITKRAARAEVPPRPSEQRISHEGVLWRRVTGTELHGAFKGLRAARSPASQRRARAQAQAAALRAARKSRRQVAAPARTEAPAASTGGSSDGASSGKDDGGSGSEDDSTGAGDEPAVARQQSVLFAIGGAS